MDTLVKNYINIISKTLPISEPIYEFGSLQTPGQETFADLRIYFSGKKYVGCDLRPGPGVDLVMDVQNIQLPVESVGTVILLNTIEHVESFWKVMSEVYRVIRSGGLLVMSSVMNYPVHRAPSDYWRFTPEAFELLLAPFEWYKVNYLGFASFPHRVMGVAVKGKPPADSVAKLEEEIKIWKRRSDRNWKVIVTRLVPPFAYDLYRWTRISLEKRGLRILPRIKV